MRAGATDKIHALMARDFLDTEALLAEAQADSGSAQAIIAALAERNIALQNAADEVRAENMVLKRTGAHQVLGTNLEALRGEYRDLLALAARARLNPAAALIATHDGHTLLFDPPASFEQTLPIDGLDREHMAALRPLWVMFGNRLDTLHVLTSSMRPLRKRSLGLVFAPSADWAKAGGSEGRSLGRGERIEACMLVDETKPPASVVIVSKLGWARQISWSAFEQLVYNGRPMATLGKGDSPIALLPCNGGDLLMISREGRWLRFPAASIEPGGLQAMLLMASDDVCAACVIPADAAALHVLGGDGASTTLLPEAFTAHKKPAGKAGTLPKALRPMAVFAGQRRMNILTIAHDASMDVVQMGRMPPARSAGDAQLLNVVNKRISAAAVMP